MSVCTCVCIENACLDRRQELVHVHRREHNRGTSDPGVLTGQGLVLPAQVLTLSEGGRWVRVCVCTCACMRVCVVCTRVIVRLCVCASLRVRVCVRVCVCVVVARVRVICETMRSAHLSVNKG